MKKYTKEDIKVGSVWEHLANPHIKGTITQVNQDIFLTFTQHPRLELIGEVDIWPINHFLRNYRIVYTIEGFEV